MQNSNNQILKNTNAKLLDEFNASVMFDKELYAQLKEYLQHRITFKEYFLTT